MPLLLNRASLLRKCSHHHHFRTSPSFSILLPPQYYQYRQVHRHRHNNGKSSSRPHYRTQLTQYEIMSAKLGRFDRAVDTLRVDAEGTVTSQKTSVRDLLLNTEMHVRDLIALSLDSLKSTYARLTPCILPRGDVTVVVLHPLRLLISKSYCIAFDPQDPSVQSIVADISSAVKIRHLEEKHSPDDPNTVAFELVILEQVLRSFCFQFSRISELLSLMVETNLKGLVNASGGALNEEELYKLVPLKDGLAVAQQNMQEVIDVLVGLLGSDEDMVALLLTERSRASGIKCLDLSLHSEVELLLENYHRQLALTTQQLQILRGRVQSVQEVFALNVDLYRNRVLRMDLMMNMISTSLASCAAVAGFYGMNLVNGLEDSPIAFSNVVSGSVFVAATIFVVTQIMMRGQGKERIRHDLDTMTAYQNIFKHIRSVSQAIYLTSTDPTDPEMGNTKAFRDHFKKLLAETRRQNEVSYQEVDILLDLINRSADTLREQRKHSEDTSEEQIYRRLFESLSINEPPPTTEEAAAAALAAANAAASSIAPSTPANTPDSSSSSPTSPDSKTDDAIGSNKKTS